MMRLGRWPGMPGFVICPYCGATVQALVGPDGRKLCPACSNRGQPAYAQPPAQPYAQPAYQPQPVYYGGEMPNAPGAVGSLVCGILAILTGILGLVLGPIALVQGNNALRGIEANPGRFGGEGMARAGRILGIVGIVIGAASIILAAVVFALVANLPDGKPVEFEANAAGDYLLVSDADPGLSWADFSASGSAGCILPMGSVEVGDRIACAGDGTVRITQFDLAYEGERVVFEGFV